MGGMSKTSPLKYSYVERIYLRLIPINEAKLTAAKMIVTFVLSVLHFSALSMEIVLDFLKMYLIQGAGVFFAVSPVNAIVPYIKKSYWVALLLAEIYSFSALFMSMSNPPKNFYPITAVFGVSGYYETSVQECPLMYICWIVGLAAAWGGW